MADFNLEAMSLKELRQLQKDLAKAISTYEDRHKAEARAKLEAIAKEMGYSLANLIGVEVKTTRAQPWRSIVTLRTQASPGLAAAGNRSGSRITSIRAKNRATCRSEITAGKCRVSLGLTARSPETQNWPLQTSDPSHASADLASAADLCDVL